MQMIQDLYLDGRSKFASYRAFLEALLQTGLPSLTHREALALAPAGARYLCIRHDVDHNLEHALAMAKVEQSLGIHASYYLLPPGDYDKDENYYGRIEAGRLIHLPRLGEVAREIAAMGHEIGLHNDLLQLSRKMGRGIEDLVLEQIERVAVFESNLPPHTVRSQTFGENLVVSETVRACESGPVRR